MRVYLLSHGVQPCIQCGAQVGIAQRRDGSSTFGVPADDDLLDLEMRNSILYDRGSAHIVRVHAVCDVAVHEDVAGPAVAHGRLRNAAVGAAYPEDLGPLALCELVKGIRICLGGFLRKHAISGYDAVDWV